MNAVVTPHHLSAEAAHTLLEAGANAVDAAVAAVAAQGVVAPETCGLGGDLFALVHRPGWERPIALNASGMAGTNADPGTLRSGGLSEIPIKHPLAVTVPGCVDGLLALLERFGSRSRGEVLSPALKLAMEGFEVSKEQARAFSVRAAMYSNHPAVAGFYPEGAPAIAGAKVQRPELARTLETIGAEGRDGFYLGQAGEDIADAVGGLITMADLEVVQADWVDPISADVGGYTAWTVPPNSQGYLGPGALAVFEMLEPPDDPEDPLRWHLLVEAYRCLAWERNDLVSDPDTAPLPAGLLLDPDRLRRAAATVDRARAGSWPAPTPAPGGTAYLCVADRQGMAVSIIQSNYRGTGSPFGAARSGFLLQDRGLGFNLVPGHPNELAPHKRPLHTLSPTLWTDGARAAWILGTRGGAVQPQLIAQMAARAILVGEDLRPAQAAPRWVIPDFGPGTGSTLQMEPGAPESTVEALRRLGHRIDLLPERQPGFGPVSVIDLRGPVDAAADPRVETTTALVF